MFNFISFRAEYQVKTYGLLKECANELSQWEPLATSDKSAFLFWPLLPGAIRSERIRKLPLGNIFNRIIPKSCAFANRCSQLSQNE